MGAVKRDIHEKERIYTQTYALNTPAGVKRLLRDRYKIAERRFRGDTAASDILIDLNSAIESAGLTDRQAEAIALCYGYWQLTQEEAAEVMGTTRKNLNWHLQGGIKRIADVFRRWNYGEITITFEAKERR